MNFTSLFGSLPYEVLTVRHSYVLVIWQRNHLSIFPYEIWRRRCDANIWPTMTADCDLTDYC